MVNFAEMETESHKLFAEGYIIGGAAHAFTRNTYLPNPADRRHPYASPLLADDLTGLPPALVITAAFDPLRDEGEWYARKLEQFQGISIRRAGFASGPRCEKLGGHSHGGGPR